MPRPPKIDAFVDMKFITNWALAGCDTPQFLTVEFSQPPVKDLLMLFFVPDVEDIGQAIFQPKGGRRRKPARHGRKRRRGFGIPDPSDLIGNRVRAVVNPYDALDFGPLRKAWKVYDVYERINFTAAVVEGVSDIFFESLWGVLKSDPDHCKDFERLAKTDDDYQVVGGVGPPLQPVNIDIVEINNGFNHTRTSCKSIWTNYIINFKAYFFNSRFDLPASGCLALQNTDTGEIFRSPPFDLKPRTGTTREVNATIGRDEWCAWGFADMVRFVDVGERNIVAFENNIFP